MRPSSGAASGASADLRLRSVVVAGLADLEENAEGSEAEGEGAMSRRREAGTSNERAHLGLEICKYIPCSIHLHYSLSIVYMLGGFTLPVKCRAVSFRGRWWHLQTLIMGAADWDGKNFCNNLFDCILDVALRHVISRGIQETNNTTLQNMKHEHDTVILATDDAEHVYDGPGDE